MISLPEGAATVRLSAAKQQTSGLIVERTRSISVQPEISALGKVMDIHALLELRTRYMAAKANAEVAASAFKLATRNWNRIASLHHEDIIAERYLVQAEADVQSERTKEESARRMLNEIHRDAEQTWGAELAKITLSDSPGLFEDLATHRRQLLLLTLPHGKSLSHGVRKIQVAKDADRTKTNVAELISAAPQTDEWVQGETWFFHAEGNALRTGMRVHAWVPVAGERVSGVEISASAVVWNDGKPWVYRKGDQETFVRTELIRYREQGGNWLVVEGLQAGDSVVAGGAQMLLSEELRGQIPEEDD